MPSTGNKEELRTVNRGGDQQEEKIPSETLNKIESTKIQQKNIKEKGNNQR